LSFHFVNKNLCVVYFPHCYFCCTLYTHLSYFRSQFRFSIEITLGKGGQLARAAGAVMKLIAK
jgi:hypothetical protein